MKKRKLKNLQITISILLILLPLIVTLQSCGEKSIGPVQYGPNTSEYQVEYNDNVIILDKKAFIEVDSTGNLFQIAESYVSSELKRGDIIVIHGITGRKVINSQKTGDRFIVETEEVKLTEIIRNCNIKWDFTPKLTPTSKILLDGKQAELTKVTGDGFEFKYTLGNWDYTINMNPKGLSEEGLQEIQVSLICENKDAADGKVTAVLSAKGVTRLPRQSGEINIQNNTLNSFGTNNKGLSSKLTFEGQAYFSAGGGNAILTLPPIILRVPLEVITGILSPVPIFIDFGLNLGATVNVPSVTGGASFKLELFMDSNAGFKYKAGPELTGNVNKQDLKSLWWDIYDNTLSPAPVEVRYDVSCPRIGVNILGHEVIWIASVFRIHSIFLVPSLCKATMAQIRLDAGYNLGFGGLTIAEDSKTFFEKDIVWKTSDCP